MIYILIAVGIFTLDFYIKRRIDKERKLGEESGICKNRIILRKYYNSGAMLDFLGKWPRLVKILCGLVMIVLCGFFALLLRKKGNRGLKLGLAFIIGGGASNLYDRFKTGHVVDYFSFRSRFSRLQRIIFNISDLFIFLGTLLVLLFRDRE